METLTEQATQLRQQVQRLGATGKGREFPSKLRAALREHAQLRRTEGASLRVIGEELGVSDRTLWYWLRDKSQESKTGRRRKRRAGESAVVEDRSHKNRKSAGRLLPVQLVEEIVNRQASIVVHGPRGVRVEGLDLPALAELLRRLS